MDLKSTQIISIERKKDKQSKYILHSGRLNEVLGNIKDKEVAIISIAGPSRQGKSFLLSYMMRYLSNMSDVNWIGRSDDPLEGFGWKTNINLQTSGIWLSKPFIVKQSNDKEIAVLLMDTQGLFDETLDQRDWSTILGISLLSSSCIIFNLFHNIQEDMLMNLESFLHYGSLSAQSNGGFEDEKPFNSLVFVIRDWNMPQVFEYGKTGGQLFLKRKLGIKDHQSPSSKKVRLLIKECFKEIACFLMPDPGEKAKLKAFDGCVDQLSSQFVDHMKEFITNLLNPEELDVRMINNSKLIAGDLCQYFDACVGIFNSKELPKTIDIVEATLKTEDTIKINKLKELYSNDLKTYLKTSPFIVRSALEHRSDELKKENETIFNRLKRTRNKDIEKELCNYFNTTFTEIYHQIRKENEQKREIFLTEAVTTACQLYKERMSKEIGFNFFQNEDLDKMLTRHKNDVNDIFSKNFEQETENVFTTHQTNLQKFIDNIETDSKKKNAELIAEADKKNTKAVNDSIEKYKTMMNRVLEQNLFLTGELLSENETECKKHAEKLFHDNCICGNSKFIKNYQYDFETKLFECKNLYQMKIEQIIQNTEKQLEECLKVYCDEMKIFFENISTQQQLFKRHEKIKSKVIDQFSDKFLCKEEIFLNQYSDELKKKINIKLKSFKSELSERIKLRRKAYENSVNEHESIYEKRIYSLLFGDVFHSDEKLLSLHEEIRKDVIHLFQSQIDYNNELKNYSKKLKKLINEDFEKFKRRRDSKLQTLELKTESLLALYEKKMRNILNNTESDQQLYRSHEKFKNESITHFQNEFRKEDPILLNKFEDKIDESFNQFKSIFSEQLKSEQEKSKNFYKASVTEAIEIYKKEMNTLFSGSNFYPDEKFLETHENLRNYVIKHFLSRNSVNIELQNHLLELIERVDSIKRSNELKRDLEEQNLILKANEIFTQYKEIMIEFLEKTCTEKLLNEKHDETKLMMINQLQDKCSFKDSKFLKPFLERFEKKTEKKLNHYKSELSKQKEKSENIGENSVKESNEVRTSFSQKEENENSSKINHEKKKENNGNTHMRPAIVMDLGTTYSCVAYFERSEVTSSWELVREIAKEEAFADLGDNMFIAKILIRRQFNETSVDDDMEPG